MTTEPNPRPTAGSTVPIPGTRFTVRIVRYIDHTNEVQVRYGNGSTGTKTLTQLQIR